MRKNELTAFIVLILLSINVKAQNSFPFTAENWKVFNGQFVDFEGKQAFMGTAALNNLEFENGTIEWDMYTTGQRAYPGIFFRMNEKQDFENFYVRSHKMNGYYYDALQYTPAYHGISCWQLYHGEGYTKEINSPSNVWVHYKLVVKDDQAKVFVGDMENEALTIHKLEHGITKGAIVLNGSADGSAYFTNFSVSENIDSPFEKMYSPIVPGTIKLWQVSEPILNNSANGDIYPQDSLLNNLSWKTIQADTNGLVNLTKNFIRTPFQPSWVYAKTTIHSDVEKSIWYSFGYSDYITIFLNGQPVFQGVNAFTSRDPSYAGLLGDFDRVNLNLKKGNNELLLMVGEQFGGWGFMFRDTKTNILATGITKKWEILNTLNYPESVVWDEKNQALYSSNFLQGQNEFISKLSIDGKVIEKEWINGVHKPTALLILGDSLYIVERNSIAVADINNASIKRRISVEGAIFLNDIAATSDGKIVFISDSQGNKIYKIENGKISDWLTNKQIVKPNAMVVRNNDLLVGCTGNLISVNIKTKEIKSLIHLNPETIVDGLQVLSDGSILFSDFKGVLLKLDNSGKVTELINSSAQNINFSDLIYIKEKKLTVIPGLYSNSIISYEGIF